MSGFSNPLVGGGGSLVYPSIHSPNFNQATQTGWSIDKNGNAFFYGVTTSGEFTGTNFIVNSAGAFFYSGTPTLGNLVQSVANLGGADQFGNAYFEGFTTYFPGATYFAVNINGTHLTFYTAAAAGGPWTSKIDQNFNVSGGLDLYSLTNGPVQLLLRSDGFAELSATGNVEISTTLGSFVVNAIQTLISAAAATGQILVVENTTAAPSEPAHQIIVAAAGDNSLGIMVSGDAFNRVKFTTTGLQIGSGGAGQDTRLTRNPAGGSWFADIIYANVSGAPETWHTLGTLAGATVNLGQFRLLPTGMVVMDIDITFGVATAVPINFSVTIPAAYRPLGSVDVRRPMAQTNASGGIGRIFVGSAGGSNAGVVQFTTLGGGTAIGTYSAEISYPVI